ncbi:phosphatidylinositol 3,4,5-trisphosphate 3-phosphatase and protein-tyrosine-phosphatase PTEN1 [Corylus avellana]|uniref:phosphatidylinositol 3,4,5-trisphosphate 3-phosphatase and protein-tyrosine-phosphatase PTEN1 n=1 Tax=Corylus avellana TaxID=13451 RepID=UPI00286A9442|nr:phosphatidylinositol 3,4,5-trisphosphate 3-phosphatase and protein-tyrosine-phosphatase PTEN1 [Corylus avellana]XP_059449646.1 phosphatidylinositol 3,4,5-trisphosphate 3-phosphatase and protein-tyrosine-phosphatase PTEN1 [Corylus avellana]XP_059449647.1 phosphatidylinositol 3,4,5-trisphosphate 3-phosphatase and protein-tyrosine-phosphatase PTEN1 [Corylus avellana]XP_059449648.1 phosphatidylinositol 3,4,5-trisphosphate 3-phosphatase and protein-tyrosine-phosphatase PTEN1 [Corylus avellana]
MGLKSSRPVPGKVEGICFQHHLVSYLSQNYLRNLVSKQRRRMLVDGYDLDMSYITDRLLAMSFPAERMRAMYRNPLWQVKSVLDMRHQGKYKIYNLCIEETYDPSHFHGRVETYPFDDNHVPPLQMIKIFCESVYSWLLGDPKNIAVVHCMAGKGRTGLMVCAYLVYTGMSADGALQLYADRRTTNNEGVSIPSQRRYVGYWEDVLSFPRGINQGLPNVNLPKPWSRELRRIRLHDLVDTDSIFFVVSELQEIPNQLYRPFIEVSRGCCRQIKKGHQRSHSPRYYLSFIKGDEEGKESDLEEPRVVVQMDTENPIIYQKPCLDHYFDKPLQVTGDVRVIFYQKMFGGRLFYCCFNTAFIRNSLLQFAVGDMDKVGKKGRSICGPAFCLELLFGPANAKHSSCTTSNDDDVESEDLF